MVEKEGRNPASLGLPQPLPIVDAEKSEVLFNHPLRAQAAYKSGIYGTAETAPFQSKGKSGHN
jgi:hypothetical protein